MPEPDPTAQRTGVRLLWAGAVLLSVFTVTRVARVLPLDSQLDQASGVFSAIAKDMAEGVFYRPLFVADGYGGTRYFPLHPALHAGLMKLGIEPRAAGYAVALGAGLGLLAGVYRLLRRLDVRPGLALPCSAFALATVSGQWAVSTIRGDLLPAALNLWGLGFCVDSFRSDPIGNRRDRLFWAAVCFTLAFSGKMTTVFGCAAAQGTLLLAGRRAAALRLALYMAGGIALFFGVMQLVSHGRFLQVMRTCATSDGDLDTLITAPLSMLVLSMRVDSMAPLFWLAAAAALLAIPRAAWRELPSLALLATAAVTLFIFGSPGTAINHCLDLHVMCLIFFVAQVARQRIPMRVGITVMAAMGLLATAGTMQLVREVDNQPKRDRYATTIRQLRSIRGPILHESPILPVLAGQRPYVLDPYMYAVAKGKDPAMKKDLEDKLDRHAFGAVVLMVDPTHPKAHDWFDVAFFGDGFRQHLLEHYRPLPRLRGQDYIYVPKADDAQGPSAVTSTGALELE